MLNGKNSISRKVSAIFMFIVRALKQLIPVNDKLSFCLLFLSFFCFVLILMVHKQLWVLKNYLAFVEAISLSATCAFKMRITRCSLANAKAQNYISTEKNSRRKFYRFDERSITRDFFCFSIGANVSSISLCRTERMPSIEAH